MPLAPPPESVYPDIPTALAAIQLHAKAEGYAFVKLDQKQNRVLFACDRAGKYRAKGKDPALHSSKQRSNTGSKKCDCPMRAALRHDRISNQWSLEVLEGSHNHLTSAAATAHSIHRSTALTSEIREQIGILARSNCSANQILMTLRTNNPEIPLIAKDISNLIQANRAEELNGKTPIQWLLEV